MTKWFDRKFDFEHNPHGLQELKTRLSAFPLKLEKRVAGLPEAVLFLENGLLRSTLGTWPILNHFGKAGWMI